MAITPKDRAEYRQTYRIRPRAILAGFMLATAFLSPWVSNTATAVMMLPIGVEWS